MTNVSTASIQSISKLPRNYVAISKQAKQDGEVILFKRNVPYLALVDFKAWETLKEKAEAYDASLALQTLKKSESEHAHGKSRAFTSFKKM